MSRTTESERAYVWLLALVTDMGATAEIPGAGAATNGQSAIEVRGLTKSYEKVRTLCGGDLDVAVRLRLLLALRLGRAARAIARGGQLGRIHRSLSAHLHLVGLRAVRFMPSVLRAFADVNPFTIVVNAMRPRWLGSPAGDSI